MNRNSLYSDDLNGKGKAWRQSEDTAWSIRIWLSLWLAIALSLRFAYLASKEAWMDEVATILFSLGNSSKLIPLNQIIDLEAVLRPLQITSDASVQDVVRHLFEEDNHPPTYFVIAHWWMAAVHRFYRPDDGYASLWAARALSALFGALAVPATYALAWISFRKQTTGLICAALMAVSPLSVYMSQEARHYSLAILMVIASLCCFASAVKTITQRKKLNRWKVLVWVLVNLLGVTVHYFCGLTVLAEGMALAVLLVRQSQQDRKAWRRSHWMGIYRVAAGTLAGVLLWLPVLTNFYGSYQTSFLRTDYADLSDWLDPIVSPVVHVVYAVMSPVTTGYSWQGVAAIVLSAIGMLFYAGWLMYEVVRSLLFQSQKQTYQVSNHQVSDQSFCKPSYQSSHQSGQQRAVILAMASFLLMANLLFLLICYSTGFNIARSHRYSFVYFPSVLLLVGAGLTPFWEATRHLQVIPLIRKITKLRRKTQSSKQSILDKRIQGKAFVAATLCIGLLSSLFVVNNISLKIYNADRFIELIQQETRYPPVIGTVAFTTEQPIVIGLDIMTIAWKIKRSFDPTSPESGWNDPPKFVLAESSQSGDIDVKTRLTEAIGELPRPFDLWMMNFEDGLETAGCDHQTNGMSNRGNYSYSHYVCRTK